MSNNHEQNVSVIICCYTEERYEDTLEAIASLEGQTRPADELILAVDNNRPLFEQMREELAGRVKVVLNDTLKGLSATRNTGIAAATGDLIAFLDDDAAAEPEWLANLVALFDDPKVAVAGGQATLFWVDGRPSWFPKELEWVVGGGFSWLPEECAEVRNPHGHNMCFRRLVFDTVGIFDSSVGRVGNGGQAGEEAELCIRLKRELPGAKVVYDPSSRILHKVPAGRASWGYLINRSYQEGACKARIRHLAKSTSQRPLDTESSYLRLLVYRSVPSRLARFWCPGSLAQAAAIVACIAATGTGYLLDMWRVRNHGMQLWKSTH